MDIRFGVKLAQVKRWIAGVRSFKPHRIALLGASLVLLVLLAIWWQAGRWFQARLLDERRAQVAAELTPYGNALSLAVNRRFALLEGLSALVQGHLPDQAWHLDSEFEAFAAGLVSSTDGIRNISVAPGGIQRFVYPLDGNENVPGHDLIHDDRPDVRADVQRTIQSRRIVVSGPYELRQGGLGLVARLAIYRESAFWGLVAIVLDVYPIVEEAGLEPLLTNLEWALRDGSGAVFYGSSAVFDAEPVIQRLHLPEGVWELAGVPNEGWQASIREPLLAFQGAGLAIAGLIAGLAYLVINRQAQLAEAVRQRTREISDVNARLGKELAERYEAEQRLRFQAQLLDSVRESVVATDLEGRVVYWGKGAEQLYGYRADEVLGKSITFIVEPHEEAEEEERMRQVRETGSWRGEYLQRRKNGTSFWADTAISLVADAQGRPQGLIGIDRDITDRKRAEDENRLLIEAIEQSAESVIITDTQDLIVYVNPAFERTTGYNRAEVLGKSPNILSSGQHDEAFVAEMWAALFAGKVWKGRIVSRKKDGALFVEDATISPVRYDRDEIVNFVAVKRDITRELELEEQYRQAQKMEAVGQLAAGIAHDFNNLLTAINGFAALLQGELAPDDPHQEPVSKILRAGHRAADLVRQLLAFSRKQAISPRPLNLNAVVIEMDKMLRRVIGEHIVLETWLAPDLGPVNIDPSQLEQVILNLAVNARDAMPEGGRLTIETSNVTLKDPLTGSPPRVRPEAYVLLSVRDSGHGMSDEVRSHIFEPFFTTKEVGQGTGLGLSMVFGIVKQNGGEIRVDSREGRGAVFKIFLPQAGEPVPAPPRQEAAPNPPSGTETILLVEDEASVRELARRVLQAQGYDLLEAQDGWQALDVAAKHRGPIHLLVTDVVMPGLSGQDLSRQLVEHRPNLKVLFISGYSDGVLKDQGAKDRGAHFLPKPFHPTDLAREVRAVLDS